MDRLFLDTNIVIDLLAKRSPFDQAASEVASLADLGKVELVVSALSFANAFYILSKFMSPKIAKEEIRKFKILTETSDLTDKVIEQGFESNFLDFEDSPQYFCALSKGCTHLIARNAKHFKNSLLPVKNAEEYLNSLSMI
jgi:predicted nucleic acid-binding protein